MYFCASDIQEQYIKCLKAKYIINVVVEAEGQPTDCRHWVHARAKGRINASVYDPVPVGAPPSLQSIQVRALTESLSLPQSSTTHSLHPMSITKIHARQVRFCVVCERR